MVSQAKLSSINGDQLHQEVVLYMTNTLMSSTRCSVDIVDIHRRHRDVDNVVTMLYTVVDIATLFHVYIVDIAM